MLRFLPMLLIFWGLTSCGESEMVNDLAGVWVMKGLSRRHLPVEWQEVSPKITLHPDGSFIASDIPGLLYIPSGNVYVDAGSGVWRLVSRKGGHHIQLDFHAVTGDKDIKVPFGTQLFVSKGWKKISLFYSLGDPDEKRRIEFEKQSN